MKTFSIPYADKSPMKLRETCERYSNETPDAIVIGIMLFNQFATVGIIEARQLFASDVRATDLGGYWKAGTFQLFTAAELEMIDSDCDCNLQKGTEFEGYHHPECDDFDGHN